MPLPTRPVSCLALAVVAFSVPAVAQPVFTPLGTLPTTGAVRMSEVWGVSGDGSTVVGSSIVSGHPVFGGSYAAFRWTVGTGMVNIYSLGGIGTTCRAFGVNHDGSVVVGMADYGVLSPTQIVAFIWRNEMGVTEIGDLPGGPSGSARAAARGVSSDGTVVCGPGESDSGAEPFRYTTADSTFLGLGDLPGGTFGGSAYGISADGGTIVGSSITGDGTQAFRWTPGDGMVGIGHLGVPDGITPFAEAYGANADGSVIVGLSRSMASSNSGWEAFRWTSGGGMVGLGDLPGGAVLSEGYAATANGSIVVGKAGVAGNCSPFGCQTAARAFIWDAQNGLRDLNVVLTGLGLNLGAWVLNEARGISADGRVIVGTGTNPLGVIEAWHVALAPPRCVADVDDGTGTGTPDGGVTIDDLLYYLVLFEAGDIDADVDNGSFTGTPDGGVTIDDLLYYLFRFENGC